MKSQLCRLETEKKELLKGIELGSTTYETCPDR